MQYYPIKDYYGLFLCWPSKLLDLLDCKFSIQSVRFYSSSALIDNHWRHGLELRFAIILFGLGFSFTHQVMLGEEPYEESDDEEIIYINEKKAWQALSVISKRGWRNGCLIELAQATLDNDDIEPLVEPKIWEELND